MLENMGLVRRTSVQCEHYLALDATPLSPEAEWFETYRAFWEGRLNALERHLRERNRR